MGAVITRHASGDGAPTLTLSEEILFKVSRGASSIYSLETRYKNTRFELEALFGATLAAASAAADIATKYAIEATKAMLLSEPKAFTISLTTREWRSDDDDEKLRKLVRDNGGSGWVREEVDGEKLPYGRATFPKPGVRLAYDAKDALLSDPLVLGVSAGGGDYRLLFR